MPMFLLLFHYHHLRLLILLPILTKEMAATTTIMHLGDEGPEIDQHSLCHTTMYHSFQTHSNYITYLFLVRIDFNLFLVSFYIIPSYTYFTAMFRIVMLSCLSFFSLAIAPTFSSLSHTPSYIFLFFHLVPSFTLQV